MIEIKYVSPNLKEELRNRNLPKKQVPVWVKNRYYGGNRKKNIRGLIKQERTWNKVKNEIYSRTRKGNELLRIGRLLERFRKKYPKKISETLEFVGIYDKEAMERLITKVFNQQKQEKEE